MRHFAGERSGPSVSGTQKLKVKGGSAVDPASGIDDISVVYQEGMDLYSIVLNKVDIIRNKNSYYKIQLLKDEHTSNHFWVFTMWGRIGTNIGGIKLQDFYSLEEAKAEYKRLYREKTGNEWESRKNFVRKADFYYPVDQDYGTNGADSEVKLQEESGNSELPLPVQRLIIMLFDVNLMKREMKEFEIDLDKMPLGKLSKKQLIAAYSVLTDIYELLGGDGKKGSEGTEQVITLDDRLKTKLLSDSERFFTLVPHSFGENRIPLIATTKAVMDKRLMLDALMEIEAAYEILGSVKKEKDGEDLLKKHYEKLKADLIPIEPHDSFYILLTEYVKNTHAKTHSQYKLKILDVFQVERHGEKKRFGKFSSLDNRMLLWHGSRVTNFASILSQGLKIAPPEAPSTGYMFGKGIYFSDMVSKSANYCFPETNNNIGLLLLSEVALGNMYELTEAEFIEKLPNGKHSVKGLGKTAPDPTKSKTIEDGVIVPCGTPVPTGVKKTTLLYNEYIVYDPAQVNIRYMIKVEFLFNF